MSLPECELVMEEHAKAQATEMLRATYSRYLASSAKWNSDVAKDLNKFQAQMQEIVDDLPLRMATRGDLTAMFAALGIKPQS